MRRLPSSKASRTSRHKTHSSAAVDEMAIAYSWHPWAERTVRIHEVIERPTGAVARCSLVDAAVARVQDIPVWMLNAAACCQTRLAAEPVAALSALAALRRPRFGRKALVWALQCPLCGQERAHVVAFHAKRRFRSSPRLATTPT